MLTFNFAFEVPKSHKVWQKWMGNGWENSKMEQLEREVGWRCVGGVVIGWLDGQVFPVEGENIAQANIYFLVSHILQGLILRLPCGKVRRDLVREIKSMLEKVRGFIGFLQSADATCVHQEWDVMDFRCPTLAVWQTKSTWLPFQATTTGWQWWVSLWHLCWCCSQSHWPRGKASYVPVAPTP